MKSGLLLNLNPYNHFMKYQLEIIGFNIESCLEAERNGATRIELCASPGEGGTTPSAGLIKQSIRHLKIPVHVMIRPRGGNFVYTDEEFEVMCDDIKYCKEIGCRGIVTGILMPEGKIDEDRCNKIVELAKPMDLTFHRAFDRVKDPVASLEKIISLGFDRILTSGLQPKATDGISMLKQLVRKANERIIIMPGSGVNAQNIISIAKETSAKEFHSSASTTSLPTKFYVNEAMNEQLNYTLVDGQAVKQMADKLQDWSAATA